MTHFLCGTLLTATPTTTDKTTTTTTEPTTTTPYTPAPVYCYADVIIVLDSSSTIGAINYHLTKLFLLRLIDSLDISGGYTRVGVVTYSSSVATTINLNAHSKTNSLKAAVALLTYHGGQHVNTAGTLDYVRTTMMHSSAGARRIAPLVVVLLTGGRSLNSAATQVSLPNCLCII